MARTFSSKWVYTCNYFYHIYISTYNSYVQFVEIKCAEHDHTLHTANMEFETTTFKFSKIVTNTCFYQVYNINTNRTTWKCCHVYRVNRGCPRGHMLVNHWSKNASLRNLLGESKRARGLWGRVWEQAISPATRLCFQWAVRSCFGEFNDCNCIITFAPWAL